ncbi:MAG: large-conductance mechanosensitive channel protein MscL [Bacteroidaceae bacterium]|nr:large-conductance mechanosensitive channel protein MscL [Bacteroidaceae bacterium]
MMTFLKDFKDFAVKGNAVDMAVGVIIGAAFGKIVSSIVDDLIMPPIGWLIGGVNFKDLKVNLPSVDLGVEKMAPATINYGNFLETLLDFVIVAFCVFMLVKAVNQIYRKKDVTISKLTTPIPTKEEELLSEIRDLLKNNR